MDVGVRVAQGLSQESSAEDRYWSARMAVREELGVKQGILGYSSHYWECCLKNGNIRKDKYLPAKESEGIP